MCFYGDLWIERERNLARIVTNLHDMRESLGLWIGLSGWLLRTWRCCNWKEKKTSSSFFGRLRFRLFCRIVILCFWQPWHLLWQCPLLWMWNWFSWACIVFHSQFQVLRMFWMAISESGNPSDIEADVLPRLWHSWLYWLRRNIHLLRTSFSAILVSYEIFSTTITISFPFLPNPPVCC